MILLSDHAVKQCEGGQSLVGGLDAKVCRNFFGSQIQSAEYEITGTFLNSKEAFDEKEQDGGKFIAVFIRAPAILTVGPSVDILATIRAVPHDSVKVQVRATLEDSVVTPKDSEDIIQDGLLENQVNASEALEVIVAARQQNILATAFHPELTCDVRWHKYFCRMVKAFRETPHGVRSFSIDG